MHECLLHVKYPQNLIKVLFLNIIKEYSSQCNIFIIYLKNLFHHNVFEFITIIDNLGFTDNFIIYLNPSYKHRLMRVFRLFMDGQ